jgi:predicted alpha/beta-fold hydrolase
MIRIKFGQKYTFLITTKIILMPIIKNTTYQSPFPLFKNCHFNTIYASQLRKLKSVSYERERIETLDDDFIDLDWIYNDKSKVVILCHGLEGNTESRYMKGMSTIFSENNWSVCAYNYRGCSGEPNRQLRAYHSGATDDLDLVIQRVLSKNYTEIVLVGFSLGGNLVLKYTGENGQNIHTNIKKTVAISTPCHLESSSDEINRPRNLIYLKRFMRKLRTKVVSKKELLIKNGFDYDALYNAKSFIEFDELFTSKAQGFKDRIDYYTKASALQFIPNIAIPTLLINAQDDSFLSSECFPITEAKTNDHFYLEMPKYGGHVGFMTSLKDDVLWSERRTLDFVSN